MKKRGYFNKAINDLKGYKEYAEELITDFCGIYKPLLVSFPAPTKCSKSIGTMACKVVKWTT